MDGLEEGDALITLDWAQKYEPLHAREKQSQYYGKAGFSYHISHAVTKIGGEFKQHTSMHVISKPIKQVSPASHGRIKITLQDATSVFLLLEHFLTELKENGIRRVVVRSDNAGVLHSR